MARVTASLPADLGAALVRSARRNERSLVAEVRLALREHLQQASLSGSRGARDGSAVSTMAAGSTVPMIVALTVEHRELILRALDDPPAGLEELRGVLLREHEWRLREGLV